jgi:SH3-like domain-containing protein
LTIFVFLLLLAWGQDGPVDEIDTFAAVIQDRDGYVNVRDEPESGGKVVDKIYNGERFFVRGGFDWEWYEVCTPRGNWGYAHKSRLKKVRSQALFPARVADREGSANLRRTPEGGVLGRVASGQIVIVLGDHGEGDVREVFKQDRWFHVLTSKGQAGYIHSSRLKPVLQL